MKAQQMLETIAVLLVFIMLAGLGLIFYAKMQQSSAEAGLTDAAMMKAIKASQALMSLPELQCTTNNIVLEGCIDLGKAKAFAPGDVNTYFDMLGASVITLDWIYPEIISPPPALVLYNSPPTKYSRQATMMIPVIIQFAGRNSFGYLRIDSYV